VASSSGIVKNFGVGRSRVAGSCWGFPVRWQWLWKTVENGAHFSFPFCFVFALIVEVFEVKTGWSFGVELVIRRGEKIGRGFGGESVTS